MSQSLIRGLELLSQLAGQPATLDELAARAAVHKTTVMRLLHDLEAQRFVFRDGQQRYRLGAKIFELSARALEQRDIRAVARPHLAALNEATGHTVHLAAFEGREVVYIDKFESRHPVRMYSRIGLTAALHSAAVAKVLLADLPAERRAAIAGQIDYVKATENTILTPPALLAELELVRQQGWAHDDCEHEPLVHCIAAPVRDASGTVVAAVSTSVPTMLLDREGLLGLLPGLKSSADAVSRELGHLPKGTTR
ncbi:MAG: IclR family transcriptional regulator [Renibacterium sp.]|nr:IclR family transcriptional regulator [Renibacterium sp.]